MIFRRKSAISVLKLISRAKITVRRSTKSYPAPKNPNNYWVWEDADGVLVTMPPTNFSQ